MTSSAATGGYGDLIVRNPNFRYLWLGQIVSLLGDWFNLIASASLVASLTGSSSAIGGLFVVRMVAPFLVTPFAGVAADRYNRKRLLIATDILRALIVFGFLLVRDANDVWLLYVLTALQLGISGFAFPARNAILPDLVDRPQLGAANALSSATWSVMLALGTALGGLVSGRFGVYTAFVVDALSFLASASVLTLISYQHAPGLSARSRGIANFLRQYGEGLSYLGQHREILVIALQKSFNSLFFSGGFQVIQVVLGETVYVMGEGGGISLGILFAMTGIGTGIGPILTRGYTGDRDYPLRIAIGVAYLVAAVGIAITAPLSAFWIVLLGMFLRGYGGGVIWVFSTQLLYLNVPDEMRGRVFATEFAMLSLASAVSAATVGWALDSTGLGLGGVLVWMAILGAVPGVFWLVWTSRNSRPVTDTSHR